ncbi:hypothetical protein [Sulfuracidifex metallicus]|uniref:hypothetical protein n=1 Tax=Sulfuracidifex metallicus TaxID=47303 RepID=UPI0022747F9F|nr:hypothetical protein [Sulfuracidifex metallicus]MCY0849563.1 hypothetical protein [Sulfuracidifex metallicus]
MMDFFKLEGLPDSVRDEDLDMEQLPQLLNLNGIREISWDKDATIYGPDGSYVKSGNGRLIVMTPLHKRSIPWQLPRIDLNSIAEMIRFLIKCDEGCSLFNPSPWEREGMSPGEISDKGKTKEQEKREIELEVNMLNPRIYFMNPFFVEEVQGQNFKATSHFVSLSSIMSTTIVSSKPAEISFNEGRLKVTGDNLNIIETKDWLQAKPVMRTWDLVNQTMEIDCKYRFPISIYRLQPSCVVPLKMEYNNESLWMILENFSNKPIIATFFIAGRIMEAYITNVNGDPIERLNIDYDRINIPIRRWGIIAVKIKIKALPEILLKKKATR